MSELDVSLNDAVLTVLIDRPRRANSLTVEILGEIAAIIESPPDAAHAVLLGSSGDRVFCSGMDLGTLGSDGTSDSSAALRRVVTAIRDCPLPIVTRVQGICLAGGVGLVLASDLVICSDAAEWGLPEIDRGIWPFMVGLLLSRHVSEKIALDWMMTGRRFTADEALAAGLVSRVVPAVELEGTTTQLCRLLATKPPQAMQMGKAAFRAACEVGVDAGLSEMEADLAELAASEDAREGIAAFLEHRTPSWKRN